ncbi:MAG: tRNA uridine-5-carboxymethylaminomethyl(34) synthesis GTPase MnmE [Oligoflexia bacterium]|nr:tRNA uridine-5-carboxymethylaminomethyl(34) synthesis GTPase MnmE [Oligoflexia bacterium]
MAESSTIAALATAPSPAGIAVIRISGPKTRTALKALFRSRRSPVRHKRELVYGEVLDFQSTEVIDRALAVYMPGPFSFTGEDVGEIHLHGSPILVQKVLRSIYAFGIDPAEPGEFSKRAFINGKIDLVQAEAISDLITATSERALIVAGDHLEGKFSGAIDRLGEPLREGLAEIEASLDFPDEDIDPKSLNVIAGKLQECALEIERLLSSYSYGQILKEGYRVLLCGDPNVGKSSLLNRLLNSDRAIVTDVSGTTRDLIEESSVLGGYKFIFCDSAGIVETSDKVEKIGVELALKRVGWADLLLLVVDASAPNRSWQNTLRLIKPQARKIWLVVNKVDLNPNAVGEFFCDSGTCAQNFYISAKTGDGLEALQDALVEELRSAIPDQAESSGVTTNERHISCLTRARDALTRAISAIRAGKIPAEIIGAELRDSLKALEELVGKTYTEDILGRIFSRFCIGK